MLLSGLAVLAVSTAVFGIGLTFKLGANLTYNFLLVARCVQVCLLQVRTLLVRTREGLSRVYFTPTIVYGVQGKGAVGPRGLRARWGYRALPPRVCVYVMHV